MTRRTLAIMSVASVGAGAATLALVACSAFGEPDEVQPSPDGALAAIDGGDGSSSVEDGAAPDARVGPNEDGGLDADGGCEEIFVEGFDTGNWATAWDSKSTADATLLVVPRGGLGDSGVLHARVSANGSSNEAQIDRVLPGLLPRTAMIGFSAQISDANQEYFEVGCTLQVQSADETSYLALHFELNGGTLSIDDNARKNGTGVPTGGAGTVGPLSAQQWYAVRLELHDIEPTRARAVGFVDGTKKYDTTVNFPAPPATVRVKCGIDHADPDGTVTVHVDAVSLAVCR